MNAIQRDIMKIVAEKHFELSEILFTITIINTELEVSREL